MINRTRRRTFLTLSDAGLARLVAASERTGLSPSALVDVLLHLYGGLLRPGAIPEDAVPAGARGRRGGGRRKKEK